MRQQPIVLRALLIDALGTLIELEPPAPVLRELLAERFAVRVSEEQARQALGAEIAHYRRHMGEGRDATSLQRLRVQCAEVLRAALPASAELRAVSAPALTAALIDALRFRAFDDAHEALLAARADGLRIVVASNWDVSLPAILGATELAELLDGIVTSAAAGAEKPSEKVFRAALALVGATPQAAVHVGDSLAQDVDGARSAGIAAVLLKRDGSAGPDGVPTISSLRELPQVLAPGALTSAER